MLDKHGIELTVTSGFRLNDEPRQDEDGATYFPFAVFVKNFPEGMDLQGGLACINQALDSIFQEAGMVWTKTDFACSHIRNSASC